MFKALSASLVTMSLIAVAQPASAQETSVLREITSLCPKGFATDLTFFNKIVTVRGIVAKIQAVAFEGDEKCYTTVGGNATFSTTGWNSATTLNAVFVDMRTAIKPSMKCVITVTKGLVTGLHCTG